MDSSIFRRTIIILPITWNDGDTEEQDVDDDTDEGGKYSVPVAAMKSLTRDVRAVSEKVTTIFRKFYTMYENFNLHHEVKQTRLQINQMLERIPPVLVPLPGEHMFDVVKRPLYGCSDQLNSDYPYLCMLCRTHSGMIIGTTTLTTAFLTRSM